VTPQEWVQPASTWAYPPGVGVARPSGSAPQQSAVPLGLSPQVWASPAPSWTKVPAGGSPRSSPWGPQQAVPVSDVAQVATTAM